MSEQETTTTVFQIAIHPGDGGTWPVVAAAWRPRSFSTVLKKGELVLDLSKLGIHVPAPEYGRYLGEALFKGEILQAFEGLLKANGDVRVALSVQDEGLRALHWQRLFGPSPGGDEWDHLARHQRTPLSIYLPTESTRPFPPASRHGLRALVVVANPRGIGKWMGFTELTPEEELELVESIETALDDVGIDHQVLSNTSGVAPTLPKIRQLLSDEGFSLLHVVAHGSFDEQENEAYIYLENPKSSSRHRVEKISAKTLIKKLGKHDDQALPRLAFFSTCESATPSERGTLAQRLVTELGLPAVVAMTDKVTMATAQALGASFYRCLDDHGQPDRALAKATAGLGESRDATVAALYTRFVGWSIFDDTVSRDDHGKHCPFRGAEPFGEENRGDFHGRSPLIDRILNKLRIDRYLVLEGPSSSGKTSLVLAGLVPALRQELEPLEVILLEPGRGAPEDLDRILAEASSRETPSLLVVDAAEKFFLEEPDGEVRRRFFARLSELPDLLPGNGGDWYALVVLRDGFEDDLSRARGRDGVPDVERVEPLSAAELRSTVEAQATEGASLRFEKGLLETLFDDIGDQAGAMGIVQTVLKELHGRRHGAWLSIEEYQSLRAGRPGGLTTSLAAVAEATYRKVSEFERPLMRDAVLRLVDLGEASRSGQGWRDRGRGAELRELIPAGVAPNAARGLAHRLADTGLVVIHSSSSPARSGEVIELADEGLIQAWPRLKRWLKRGRDILRAHKELGEAAREWRQHREAGDDGRLADHGLSLEKLEGWAREGELVLSREEQLYLDAWRKQGEADAARQLEAEKQRAREARARAEVSLARQLAAQSYVQRDVRLDQAALLAIEAQRRMSQLPDLSDAEGRRSLLAALNYNPSLERYFHPHDKALTSVAWSPDGRTLATADIEGNIVLLDAQSGLERTRFASPGRGVNALAWSGDGSFLASADVDGMLRLWKSQDGTLELELYGHSDALLDIAWNPAPSLDGPILASASADGTLCLWYSRRENPQRCLEDPAEPYWDSYRTVAWSDDGRLVAASGQNYGEGVVPVWDVASGEVLRRFKCESIVKINTIAFRPGGRTFAVAGLGPEIYLFDADREAEEPVATLPKFGWWQSLTWSADGRRLAAGAEDSLIQIWSAVEENSGAVSFESSMELRGHVDDVTDLAFHPERDVLISSGSDKVLIRWNLAPDEVPLGTALDARGNRDLDTWSAAFDADGRAAAGGPAHTAVLWELATGNVLARFEHPDTIMSLAFQPGGGLLAAASADGVHLWDVASAATRGVLPHRGMNVWSLAWSPDGRRLAAAGNGESIVVWDPEGRREEHRLDVSGPVSALAWSGPAHTLAAAGEGQILLWDVLDWKQSPRILTAHHGQAVGGLAWHGEGRILASGGEDNQVFLWDVEQGTGEPLVGHKKALSDLAWHRDGKILATSGRGDSGILLWDAEERLLIGKVGSGEVLLYMTWSDGDTLIAGNGDRWLRFDVDPKSWRERACLRAGRNLTREEWRHFLGPDVPYRRTCPELPPENERGTQPERGTN